MQRVLKLITALLLMGMTISVIKAERSDHSTVTYETIIETYEGDKLVDTKTFTDQVPTELELSAEDLEESEIHLFVTFTRTKDVFLTTTIILSILLLVGFVLQERYEQDDDEEEGAEEETESDDQLQDIEANDLKQPLVLA